MADPVCCQLVAAIQTSAKERLGDDARLHTSKTCACIDGPQSSTRTESRWFRAMGADVVGMTAIPEAKIAREVGIAYATLGVVTDYDPWDDSRSPVCVDAAMAILASGMSAAKDVALSTISTVARRSLRRRRTSPCAMVS